MIDDAKLLSDLASTNPDVRFAAWRAAGDASPAVIPQLGKLAASANPGIAKAGREALTTLTHSVGKDPAAPKRAGVVKGLLDLASATGDVTVRTHAIRLLSNIAGPDSVPAIARLFSVPELREEVVYCVERVPGAASDQALMAAYKSVPDDFKPRVLNALGHRRTADALSLAAGAMSSANPDIATAATRAFGRIGKKPASPLNLAAPSGLSPWQAIERMDSLLRYAEAQAKAGNVADAAQVYQMALQQPQEHYQCAGVIGLARLGTPEAAAMIMAQFKNANARVSITARNAWKAMAAKA